jgi:hypothetical protein
MRHIIASLAISSSVFLSAVGIALAANPQTRGQPNKSCEDFAPSLRPGNANLAPGSAFNPDGKAGTVYAGEQPQNSQNPHSVSQYDVACFQSPP